MSIFVQAGIANEGKSGTYRVQIAKLIARQCRKDCMSINLEFLQPFHLLQNFLNANGVSFISYQTSEYLLRLAMQDYNSITRFSGQDFSAELDPNKIHAYFIEFKNKYEQDWGKQPFSQSGVSDEKLSSIKDLEHALRIIETELSPFVERSKEVAEFQVKVAATVERMRKKLGKELKVLQELYKKEDFWDQQQQMYLAASKIFVEQLFNQKIQKINVFMKEKNDFYFSAYDKKLCALDKQLTRYLIDLKLEGYIQNFIKKNKCEEIISEVIRLDRALQKKAG